MTPELEKELIAAAGTAVGALLAAFKDDIKDLVLSIFSSKNAYLKGVWNCTWEVTSGAAPGANTTITDQVTIAKVRGISLKGKGNAKDFGGYNIDGKVGEYVVTLQYEGEKDRRGLEGVVILKRASNTYLQGVWSQYAEQGTLKAGSTEWRK